MNQNCKLCYVSAPWLYFTESLEDQWGDDWDDAPYEHNAGRPYGVFGDKDRPDVFKVAVSTSLLPPSDPCSGSGGSLSVEQINNGAVPWLSSPKWDDEQYHVYAGETYSEAVETIETAGGTVYTPE